MMKNIRSNKIKIILSLSLSIIILILLCGCPGATEFVDVNITLIPENPNAGDKLTIKSSDRNIFEDYEVSQLICFNANYFDGNEIKYHIESKGESTFKKISNFEAQAQIKKCATGGWIRLSQPAESKKCGYTGWYEYEKTISFDYPKYLSLNKTTAKASDTVTVTSSTPFFDEVTFSMSKVNKLLQNGYYIVWYCSNNGSSANNPDKRPLVNQYLDIDSLSPTSITFTIPEDAVSGTIHIINEGGFVVEGINDLNIVGNVDDAAAYYTTAEELTITK